MLAFPTYHHLFYHHPEPIFTFTMSESRIQELELENERLKEELESLRCSGWDDDSSQSNSSNEELVEFLSTNKKDLSLDFLKNLHVTFTELQRQEPDKNFNELLEFLVTKSTSDQVDGDTPDHIMKELEVARVAQRSAEIKLQLMRQKHEEELSLVNDINVEHLSKNRGVQEFMDRLTERKKVNDDLVKRLRQELEYRNKEIDDLRDRYRSVEKLSQEYLKAWKDAQRQTRRSLEANHYLSNQRSMNERSSNQRSILNISPTPLFDENNHIPPPPPMEEPSLDEIPRGMCLSEMQAGQLASDTHETYSGMLSMDGLDDSIPPPPDVSDADEIFNNESSLSHNHSRRMV